MAVNEQVIIKGVRSLKVEGDSSGLIQAFDVYLTNFYTDFWNDFSFEFEKAIIDSQGKDFEEVVSGLLIIAAEDCGCNTFNGIMNSNEWKGLVAPMVENNEDKIYALNAVQNALGWGKIEVTELIPGEKLVLKIHSCYEADGYLKKYGKAKSGKCYMLTGVAAAFMELVYNGVKKHPSDLVDQMFFAQQVKGIEMGDAYGEIVATRK
jgi:hypothetical protein